jgi:hypothetical protein
MKGNHINIYDHMAVPMLTYGGETWTFTKQGKNEIQMIEIKFLRNLVI